MPKNVKVGVRVVVTAAPFHTGTPERLAEELASGLNDLFEHVSIKDDVVSGFGYCNAKVEEITELQCAHCGRSWQTTIDRFRGALGEIVCLHCGKGDSDG